MSQKLKAGIINLFSVGPIGFYLMMNFVGNYYTYFLTDILKLGAASAGTIMLVARIVDAVAVPVTGGFVELTRRKLGRYTVWLWIAPPLTTLFVALMFTGPGLPLTLLAVFLGLMYVLAHLLVNLAEATQYALIPVIAYTAEDRMLISCRRAQALSAAGLIFGLAAPRMIIFLGGGNEGRGIFLTVLTFALLQMIGYWIVAKVSMPFDRPQPAGSNQNKSLSLKDMVMQVAANKPLFTLIVAEVCRWSASIVVMGYGVYYFKYVAGNESMISLFFIARSIARLLGSALGQYIAVRTSQKNTWNTGMGMCFAAMTVAWFIAEKPWLFILFCALADLGHSIATTLSASLFADVAEYAEWKTKTAAKGIVMALSSLPIKISMALSGAITGYSLGVVGYIPDVLPTARVVKAISSFITLIPAVFALLSIIAIYFYPLTEERVAAIRRQSNTGSPAV